MGKRRGNHLMKSKVALVRDQDPGIAVRKVLELIEAQKLLSSGNRVLLQPNYITAQKPSTGVTTDTRIIACLIAFLKESDRRFFIASSRAFFSYLLLTSSIGALPVLNPGKVADLEIS